MFESVTDSGFSGIIARANEGYVLTCLAVPRGGGLCSGDRPSLVQ